MCVCIYWLIGCTFCTGNGGDDDDDDTHFLVPSFHGHGRLMLVRTYDKPATTGGIHGFLFEKREKGR